MEPAAKPKAPDYGELAEALRIMTYAYDRAEVRYGLKTIGLSHRVDFPSKHSPIQSTDDARRVLIRLEEALGEEKRAHALWDQMDEWGEKR